jgi:acyl-CoA thioester hydrolase
VSTHEHPSHGYFREGTHVLPIRVYYEDTDFSGVVYHGAFVKFLERGRTEFLRAAGVHHKEMLVMDEPIAFTIHKLNLSYWRPARIDEALEVRTQFYTGKGVRLEADQSVWRDDVLLVSAEVTASCINLEGRPRRMPAFVRDQLAPRLLPGRPEWAQKV